MTASLCIVMSVYGQPIMLDKQLRTIAAYEEHIRRQLKVIVVDDHGDPQVTPDYCSKFEGLDLHAYRVLDNIPWNQMGARNLGMDKADPTWCLMIDPDMVFRESMMVKVLHNLKKMRPREVVRYGLRHMSNPDAPVDMTSPNTYLIHRDSFFAAGGYDEDYAGHKGWSDVQLLDVLRAHYKLVLRPDIFADFYSLEQISDAEVHTLDRSIAHNKKIRIAKVKQKEKAGSWVSWAKKHNTKRIRFRWTVVFPIL